MVKRKETKVVTIKKSVLIEKLERNKKILKRFQLALNKKKHIEEVLRTERNLLRTLIDNLPDLIYFKDSDERYILNNRAHLRSLGAEQQEDVLGKSTFDFNPPELAKQYHVDEMLISRTGKALLGKEETALHHGTGKKCWHLTSKIPLKDDHGKVTGIVGISRDITELKETEEKICKLNRVYEVLSNVNQIIVRASDQQTLFNDICKIVVRDGKFKMAWIGLIDEVSRRMKVAASYGFVGDYLENHNVQLNQEKNSNCPTVIVIETMEYCVSNDIESDPRMTQRRESMLKHGYRSFCALPLVVFGNPYGILYLYSDQRNFFDEEEIRLLDEMTADVSFCIESILNEEERKKDEEELRKAKEKAEEANRLKNSFLGRMSHEFRTPLNGILGGCNIIKEFYYKDTNETTRKVFDSIEEECLRLLTTMTQVLDISSVESRDFKVDLKPLSLNSLVLSSYQSLKLTAEKKNIRVDLNLPESEIIAQGDEYCLRNIIINVLHNAIKFSNQGTINIIVDHNKRYGICSITDEGIGMSEEYQRHLFELFSQEDVSYTRPFDGAGLGLALASRYIDFMKGDIKFESKKGSGTVVTLKVPLLKDVQK